MNSQDLTTMKDIGKLIRDIRKQQGVTQEELVGINLINAHYYRRNLWNFGIRLSKRPPIVCSLI